jgi:TolB-like protein/DNA-binding winged helix-turn-helix (wHTH) protein
MNNPPVSADPEKDFLVGDHLVRPQRGCIEREGRVIRVKPKTMAVLQCLARAGGEVVTRAELFDTVWGRAVVSDAALTQCIVELRSAFGDTARASTVIETVPRVGFRLAMGITAPASVGVEHPQGAADVEDTQSAAGVEDPQATAGAEEPQGAVGAEPRSERKRVAVPALLISLAGAAVVVLALVFSGGKPGQVASEVKTLAVLPFVDMSPDQDQQHFADGITEELIHGLSRQPQLMVIGRTSAFMFKDRSEDLREIGRLLDVDHILEGSVRKSGDQLRITANLIEVSSGASLWSRSYERTTAQYFECQKEISSQVIAAMAIETGLGEPGHVFGTSSFEAYEYVMKFYAGDWLTDTDSILRDLEYLRMATEIDPGYAFAWGALSLHYSGHQDALSPDWRELSHRYLERALALDDNSAQLWEVAAHYYAAINDWSGAEQALSRVPRDSGIAVFPGHLELLVKVGRASEVIELGERQLRRDPLNSRINVYLQHAYAISGMTDKALEQSEIVWKGWPTPQAAQEAMLAAFAQDDPAVIRFWLERLLASGDESATNPAMAERFDNPQFALDWLRQAEFDTHADRYVAPAWAAYLGDAELALDLMRKSPDPWAFWMPHNAEVRQLDGFKDLLRDVGLVDYWRKSGWGE